MAFPFNGQSNGGPSGFGSPKSPTHSTEKSVKSCYAVVYNLIAKKWVVAGAGGWSEVHLCRDSKDHTHRLLAWTVKSQEVLLNANVTADCVYKEKSKNFHSFTGENGERFGLGFHKSDSGLKQAEHFVNAVKNVILECKEKRAEAEHLAAYGYGSSHPSSTLAPASTHTSVPVMGSKTPPPNPIQQAKLAAHGGGGGLPSPHRESDTHDRGKIHSSGSSPPGGGLPRFNAVPPPAPGHGTSSSSPQPSSSASTVALAGPSSSQPLSGVPQTNGLKHSQSEQHSTRSTSRFGRKKDHDEAKRASSPKSPRSLFHFGKRKSKKHSMGAGNDALPQYHLKREQTRNAPKGAPKLGVLAILPPKPIKERTGDSRITDVSKVERITQVTYDKEAGVFHGLPAEWQSVLNKQFGVSPKTLPGIKMGSYSAKIPKVLVTLKENIVEKNGWHQVGIFRLAPNAQTNDAVKDLIDTGTFDFGDADVNVFANLIKVWFRDLPTPLLNCAQPERVEMAEKTEQVVELIGNFPEPNKSIFLWLCDMCVECAAFSKENKMGPKNLAIVIGPNLFNTNDFSNPMKAMTYSQKIVQFFEKAIVWRQGTQ